MNKLVFSLTLIFFSLQSCKKKEEAHKDAYDVFLIMGQSNTENGLGIDPSIDLNDEGVLQLGRNNGNNFKILKAIEPLENWDQRTERNGYGLTFAKLYKNNLLTPGRKVLLIACGKGSSGFNNNLWNKGDQLYEDAVFRANWVMENFPGSEIKAVLWHQGEQDVGNPDFQNQLDAMVTNLRIDLKNSSGLLPFIAGGMVPYWTMQNNGRQKQEMILKQITDRLPKTGFADPWLPFLISKADDNIDTIHFDANGQRELGKRYFSAYKGL